MVHTSQFRRRYNAQTQFGANGDVPVAGDYDGDGSADVTVYRGGDLVHQPFNDRIHRLSISERLPTFPIPAKYHP